MATLSKKPGQRYTVPDWITNSQLISTNAERQRYASHQMRQEARALRNETNNQAKWDEHDNRTRLGDRITDVNNWKWNLEKCLADIDAEIDALSKMKDDAERCLEANNMPLDVAIECLTLREGHRAIDVVRDLVDEELHKEVHVIEGIRKALQQKISEAFEQLCLLQEARQQLNLDQRNKSEALEIDRVCLSLNPKSPNISLKPNPTRVPYGSTTPQQWDQFSQYNKDRAEAEMRASTRLREEIAATITQTNNELEAQRIATEFAFRKRIHEFEQAYDELKWQQTNTKEEIEDLEEDIRRLEEDLRAKMGPLKVAHTRLETRTYRPNVELCRDMVQYGITDEVHQLEGIIAALKEKLKQAQHALHLLYQNLARIEEDMGYKANSLKLDNRCMDTRRKLTIPAEKYVPDVDMFNRTTNRVLSPLKSRHLELV
ncbi:tektin-2 [Latimeria chalumnae]|uniref:Tektin n=1 Tax=Latimeria chalumnae TaxID=7897 RepID=H3BCQ7_LATCH|nr:PREDICTED: tektin-2 [Latimeria chalumnae]XP_014352745.1 PREDICTED: tektin-2 [Latimeria chalumnae]XP_014352747.1 PREDICTED: tektin-2 [Latimeria chalumnae]|eukprot:XP_014352741.1 PREDICTED: tektin-2 [Latimeria chalumnae]